MTYPVPTFEPPEVAAGDSVTWKKTLNAFKPSDGWVLSYVFLNAIDKIELSATASGDDHLISATSTDTDGWAAGVYSWQSYVTKGSERHLVNTGKLTVRPNFADLSAYDDRSHAARVLEAIEAVLENRATQSHLMYEIAGRKVQSIPFADLIVLRDRYRVDVRAEEDAERAARGLGSCNKLLVRF